MSIAVLLLNHLLLKDSICETVVVFCISFHESICAIIKTKGHWSSLPSHINPKKEDKYIIHIALKIAVAVMLKQKT